MYSYTAYVRIPTEHTPICKNILHFYLRLYKAKKYTVQQIPILAQLAQHIAALIARQANHDTAGRVGLFAFTKTSNARPNRFSM